MQYRIKEHDRHNRLARTQTSAVSEHAHNTGYQPLWSKVKFIDRGRAREAIHKRLHPSDINKNSDIEIPEAWMPTFEKRRRKTADRRGNNSLTSRIETR